MRKLKLGKSGFTLIELLVVVVIVAVLAAVAVPLFSGNIVRARASECEAALGTVKTALRAYYAENQTYKVGGATSFNATAIPGISARVAGTSPGDLDGRFFSEECYVVTSAADTTFTATCTWNDSVTTGGYSPKAADVNTTSNVTTINELGDITRTGY